MTKLITRIFFLSLLSSSFIFSQIDEGGTGSFGDFSPKAFLESPVKWKVFRASGVHERFGYPCNKNATNCGRKKEYSLFDVRSQNRKTSINVGVGLPLGDVTRESYGTHKKVAINSVNGFGMVRIDASKVSSRYGMDGAETTSISRNEGGVYGSGNLLTHIEAKGAAWARIQPYSFYYHDKNNESFALTVVEKMSKLAMAKNYLSRNAGAESIREGTYWCLSDAWKLEKDSLTRLFANDEFDMSACKGEKILSSETNLSLSQSAAAWLVNRQDSKVTLHQSNLSYNVKAKNDWFCPFDCDGTTYTISVGGQERIKVSSDRWNHFSTDKFKIKVVEVDWDNDGFGKLPGNLYDLAGNTSRTKDIVAVIVTSIPNFSSKRGLLNGNWTQHTFMMFPNFIKNTPRTMTVPGREGLFGMKVLDAVLAMMPDQTQTSPELADAEQKLDELRAFYANKVYSDKIPNSDKRFKRIFNRELLNDIYSEVDATSAISWNPIYSSKYKQGKIEWMLGLLGY